MRGAARKSRAAGEGLSCDICALGPTLGDASVADSSARNTKGLGGAALTCGLSVAYIGC